MRVVMCAVVLVFAAMAAACGGAKVSTTPAAKEEAKRVYTRDEFRKLVVGKSQDEVLKTVGKPESTSDGAGMLLWYYNGLTRDPIAEKTDARIQVCFKEGVATEVNY